MKPFFCLILLVNLFSCNSAKDKIKIDETKHVGLTELKTDMPYRILYSPGEIQQAKKNAELLKEAYLFLSDIMGPKEQFCLLVVSEKDWGEKNTYFPASVILPCYFMGNVIISTGKDLVAKGIEKRILSFPEESKSEFIKTFTNDIGEPDGKLFSEKLLIHELTHCFQDPRNKEIPYGSRYLWELHANMGLYAFYKSKRPNELKSITQLVDFYFDHLPTDIKYTSLSDFDTYNIDEMSGENYEYYQMKLTKAAQIIIDSLGNSILKSVNDFIVKYDDARYEKLITEDYNKKLAIEIDPRFIEIIHSFLEMN
ncbi:MAG: hypothetical protein K0M40_13265 [Prolixibacteraceae bacterium]|nr:hypothetical protein [Prolixibacteraceae bacterium]